MSSQGSVAFDPNDPVQQAFLSALALGETGNSSYAATEGVGGTDLAGDTSTDSAGFPLWSGEGDSHAAGIFQFEPATWDSIAQQYGLNFANTSDQEAGAWYLAQQTYSADTGRSLYSDLSSDNYSFLDTALAKVWPSVAGNAAAPQGLAATLAGGGGASLPFPEPHPLRRMQAHLLRRLGAARAQRQAASSATSRTGSSAEG